MSRKGLLVSFVVGLALVWFSPSAADDAEQDTPYGPLPVASEPAGASQRTVVPQVKLTPEMQERAGARLEELRSTAEPLSRAVGWVDDFEDGDLIGWSGPESTCNAWVDFIGANGTGRSLRIDGYSSHFGGMHYDMGPGTPTGLHLSVRPGSTTIYDTYFVASDAASYGTIGAIFFLATGTGQFVAVSDVDYDCGPYSANVWYDVSFNIEWQCGVYDVYIDSTLRQYNVPLREYFNVTPDNVQFLDLYNWNSSTAWWDEIWVSTPGVTTQIFADGFERGSTCRWSSSLG